MGKFSKGLEIKERQIATPHYKLSPLPPTPRIVVILALAKCRLAIKLSLQIVYFQAWGRTMLQISGQWCLFLIKYVEKQLARFANFYVFKARS